jgi:hypothetical protein
MLPKFIQTHLNKSCWICVLWCLIDIVVEFMSTLCCSNHLKWIAKTFGTYGIKIWDFWVVLGEFLYLEMQEYNWCMQCWTDARPFWVGFASMQEYLELIQLCFLGSMSQCNCPEHGESLLCLFRGFLLDPILNKLSN